jgi:hypothetical protein
MNVLNVDQLMIFGRDVNGKHPKMLNRKIRVSFVQNMNVIEKLNNELEIREYQFSGMCTICQNKLFVNEDNKTPS